jgi:PAS domain S-box-containing protein
VKTLSEDISSIDYRQILEYSLDPVIIHTKFKILYVNSAAEVFFRGTKEEINGASPLDIFKESSKAAIKKRILSAYEHPAEVIEETIYRMDGTPVEVELYCHPARIGDTKAIQTYVRDITNRKESEKEHKKQINELSATVVPLLDGIAVLPLVGSIDEERASQLLEEVPFKVQRQKVECLIIDFSGIYNFDDVVTDTLFKINCVLSMLGVRSILTGLRPELALTAIQQDIDFAATPAMSTVKDALYSLGINFKNDTLTKKENYLKKLK